MRNTTSGALGMNSPTRPTNSQFRLDALRRQLMTDHANLLAISRPWLKYLTFNAFQSSQWPLEDYPHESVAGSDSRVAVTLKIHKPQAPVKESFSTNQLRTIQHHKRKLSSDFHRRSNPADGDNADRVPRADLVNLRPISRGGLLLMSENEYANDTDVDPAIGSAAVPLTNDDVHKAFSSEQSHLHADMVKATQEPVATAGRGPQMTSGNTQQIQCRRVGNLKVLQEAVTAGIESAEALYNHPGVDGIALINRNTHFSVRIRRNWHPAVSCSQLTLPFDQHPPGRIFEARRIILAERERNRKLQAAQALVKSSTAPTPKVESLAGLIRATGADSYEILLGHPVYLVQTRSVKPYFVFIGVHVEAVIDSLPSQQSQPVFAFIAQHHGTSFTAQPLTLMVFNEESREYKLLAKPKDVHVALTKVPPTLAFRNVQDVEHLLALVSPAIVLSTDQKAFGVVNHRIPIVPWCRGRLALMMQRALTQGKEADGCGTMSRWLESILHHFSHWGILTAPKILLVECLQFDRTQYC
ncbi:hypothetical protein SVAN01_07761 [Stagonosporopsis vannaccii]|nr:hypothetical protein SVAN01_07761 [Stagonosporopsis vannaccii]